MSEGVPDSVRAVLVGPIGSLMTLELLLALARSGRSRWWTADELGRELRCTPDWAEREARRMTGHGLVDAQEGASPARFRVGTPSEPASSALSWLIASYPERRFSIIQAMYPPPGGPIQSFADAFRLRKERSDG